MKTPLFSLAKTARRSLAAASVLLACAALPAHAQNTVYNFDNLVGDGNYNDARNWDQGAVPSLATTNTAVIGAPAAAGGAPGVAVTYNPGGDLIIKNGGILQIASGSFTQAGGNNYYQLNGNGTVLISGGTFSQGTASSTPFNVTGTGNALNITAGAFNVRTNFSLSTGLNFNQSGGTVMVAGNETDFNSATNVLSGGVFNTNLITGVNGPNGSQFNISGGTLNLTGSTAIYGGGANQFINFTPNSAGQITFSSGTFTIASVKNFLNSGAIEYNSTIENAASGYPDFTFAQNGANVTLGIVGVPEPSSVALIALGAVGLAGWALRRRGVSLA